MHVVEEAADELIDVVLSGILPWLSSELAERRMVNPTFCRHRHQPSFDLCKAVRIALGIDVHIPADSRGEGHVYTVQLCCIVAELKHAWDT